MHYTSLAIEPIPSPWTLLRREVLMLLHGLILLLAFGVFQESAAQIAVASDLVLEKEAGSGDTYEGTIQIRNTSGEFQEVRLYKTDYLFYASGESSYGDPGSHPRSNADWITLSSEQVKIPPGQTLPITFQVAVPAGSNPLQGSYWSMVMVQAVETGQTSSSDGFSLKTQVRFGVQIVTHLLGTGERAVSLSNTQLVAEDDEERVLEVDIVNEGTLAIRPRVWLELYSASGTKLGEYEGSTLRIYPGTSVRNRIDLGDVNAGAYTAVLFVDAGSDDVFGAQYNLQF